METNVILAGVGGQGILSIAFVIDTAALQQGLQFKQAEVHGMSQRGGEVQSHLRFADHPIHSELVPKGAAHLVLSVEPLESLRYVEYLSPEGAVVTGIEPYRNIPNYPDHEQVLEAVASLPRHVALDADHLAREAGSARAQNMVLLGAASPWLGLRDELLEAAILQAFAAKGERIQQTNIAAFRAGKAAGAAYRALVDAGTPGRAARTLCGRLAGGVLDADAVAPWTRLLAGALSVDVLGALAQEKKPVQGRAKIAEAILAQGKDAKLAELLFIA